MRIPSKKSFMSMLIPAVAALALMIPLGCDLDGSSSSSKDFSGTWVGNVCGRDLEMEVNQDGRTLTGTYTLRNPTFSESFQGTVASSSKTPTSATLQAGGDRTFELTFHSTSRLSGTFLKSGEVVCNVNAVR